MLETPISKKSLTTNDWHRGCYMEGMSILQIVFVFALLLTLGTAGKERRNA